MKSSYDQAKSNMDYYRGLERDWRGSISSTENNISSYKSTLRYQCRDLEENLLLGGGVGGSGGVTTKFSSHLASIVELLELRYAELEKSGAGVCEMRGMKASIDELKKQYDVIVDACG